MTQTSAEECLSVPYDEGGKEGCLPVPGGVLHYRISGNESANDIVVFESGWGALFPYAAWLEQALSPHARIISYDRAGIGDSTSTEPITTARLTEQLQVLLFELGVSKPVVVVGHSYGGLIAALHAAQAPAMVRAVVQVDPTPEYPYEGDKAMDSAPITTLFTKLAIRLGFTGIVTSMYAGLPKDALHRLTKSRAWMIKVLNGSIPEIRLFRDIQRVIQAPGSADSIPRLVISGMPPERKGLFKMAFSQERLDGLFKSLHAVHKQQASRNATSRWMQIPYDHYAMLSQRGGGEILAGEVRSFMQAISTH